MENIKYIKYVFIALCVGALLYLAPSIFHLFMPFILALIVAAPFHKLVSLLENKLHIKKGISSIIIFILIIGIIFGVVGFAVYYIASQFKSFAAILPDMIESLKVTLKSYYEQYRKYMPSIASFIDNNIHKIGDYTPKITNSTIDYATNFAISIPSFLFAFLMFLLALFFLIKDYRQVIDFVKEILPDRFEQKLHYIKETAWTGFVGYIKSQAILSSITALLIAVTFWVLGVEYSVVWAIIIGVVDFIPILGSGIILVPFAIIHFLINKNLFFSVCVIILQVVAFVVRQTLSPKVMSSQLGLHPLVTLISIYAGNELLGFMGMIIFPIIALLLVSLYNSYKASNRFTDLSRTGSDDKAPSNK